VRPIACSKGNEVKKKSQNAILNNLQAEKTGTRAHGEKIMVGVQTRKLLKGSVRDSMAVTLPAGWVRFHELVNGGRLVAVEAYETELGLVVRPAKTVTDGVLKWPDNERRPLMSRLEVKLSKRYSPRMGLDDNGQPCQIHWSRVYRSGKTSTVMTVPKQWIQRVQLQHDKALHRLMVVDFGQNLLLVPRFLNLPNKRRSS
jgi:hypothetical protein